MSETLAPTHAIIGSSPALREALGVARVLARGATPILIVAEKGLETTEIGMLIHTLSGRQGPFHRVFAPELASPDERGEPAGGLYTRALVHNVLHELITRAQGGTLLIEEIGELPWFGQAIIEDLLTQQARGTPGADVRVLASSSVDLYVEANDERFREGLLARLLFSDLWLPPLRKRGGDAAEIAQHLLRTHPYLAGRTSLGLDNDAVATLIGYSWPGNLPELEAVVVRAANLAGDAPIGGAEISLAMEGVACAFDPLWPDEHEPGPEPPGPSLLRDLEPDPRPEPVEMVTDELAARVFGKEILAPSNAMMKEHALATLGIALRRVMAKLDAEGVLHERDLREVTLLRGKQAPGLMDVLVEDGVLVLAPVTGRKRAWSRAPEA